MLKKQNKRKMKLLNIEIVSCIVFRLFYNFENCGFQNLTTIFGVSSIPENTQLRIIVDKVDSECFRPVFKEYLGRLQRGKHLEQYQFSDGKYICNIDGTQFFSSKKVDCPQCLTATHENGKITCSHKVLQGVIIHPDIKQILSLMPEQIVNSDGTSKQDCGLLLKGTSSAILIMGHQCYQCIRNFFFDKQLLWQENSKPAYLQYIVKLKNTFHYFEIKGYP